MQETTPWVSFRDSFERFFFIPPLKETAPPDLYKTS